MLEQRLDRVMKDKQTLDKQRQDRLITTLSSTLTTAVNAKLDKLIKVEMKNNVIPGTKLSIVSLDSSVEVYVLGVIVYLIYTCNVYQ